LCLLYNGQDRTTYINNNNNNNNNNNTYVLSNVWSVDYNKYCFLNQNLKMILKKYKVKVKYIKIYFPLNILLLLLLLLSNYIF